MSARSDFRKFVKEIEAAGGTIRRGRGSHLLVYVGGRHITTISPSGTKGRNGTAKASRRELRQAGLDI